MEIKLPLPPASSHYFKVGAGVEYMTTLTGSYYRKSTKKLLRQKLGGADVSLHITASGDNVGAPHLRIPGIVDVLLYHGVIERLAQIISVTADKVDGLAENEYVLLSIKEVPK